jgi:tetratricopeptide (TPR) repeat protein
MTQPSDARQADLTSLGAHIKAARQALGLSQADVAKDDFSVAYMSRIEAGQRRPDSRILGLIAGRLNTTPESLRAGVSSDEHFELQLTLQFGEMALRNGEAHEAALAARQLLNDRRVSSSSDLSVDARWLLGRSLETQGDLTEAVAQYDAVRRDTIDRRLPVYIALSRCFREAGDLDRAIEIAEEGLTEAHDLGLVGTDEDVQLTVTLAAAYSERGDALQAEQLCAKAVERAEATGSVIGRSSAYWNASAIASRRGAVAEAVALGRRALALLAEADDASNLARLRLQLGIMQLRLDPPDVTAALHNLRRARDELLAADGSVTQIARCDVSLARAYLLAGNLGEANELAAAAAAAARQSPMVAGEAHAVLGAIAMAEVDTKKARSHYAKAVAVLSGAKADRQVAQLWYELGELLTEAGDQANAGTAFRSAAAAAGLRSGARFRLDSPTSAAPSSSG